MTDPEKKEPAKDNLEKGVVVYTPTGSTDQITLTTAIVRRFFCEKATEVDAYSFMGFCRYSGLNPFLNECFLSVFDGEAHVMVAYTAFMKRAERHRNYRRFRAGVALLKTDTAALDFPGETVDGVVPPFVAIQGTLIPPGWSLAGGWCQVWRSDRGDEPIVGTAALKEHLRKKSDGHVMKMWDDDRGMPATMIWKTAIAKSFRLAFPDELAGFYLPEEFAQRQAPAVQVSPKEAEEATTVPAALLEIAAAGGWTRGKLEMWIAEQTRQGEVPAKELEDRLREVLGIPRPAALTPAEEDPLELLRETLTPDAQLKLV